MIETGHRRADADFNPARQRFRLQQDLKIAGANNAAVHGLLQRCSFVGAAEMM